MKHILLLLCAVFVLHLSLCAQEQRGFLNRTPEFPQINTPVAASFHKFVDQPVSPYTGTPEITVPLITLEDGMIRLPIALRYNSSGIKVSEEAGWVGLGWNLQVGGVITQQTVGDFDQIDTEYKNLLSRMELTTDRIYNWSTYPYTQTMHNAFPGGMHKVGYRAGKMNPDVFYYSYPGGSGKFIIDYRTDQIHILNREENIRIEITRTSSTQAASIQEFRITTTEGSNTILPSIPRCHTSMSRSTWYLSAMCSPPVSTPTDRQ
ncbi:MAG: hypothetical protein LUF85_03925 [Bacteroides sp.]|nr:hypothetical protein [Bacteroides sp.]